MIRITEARDVVTGCKKFIKYSGLHDDTKPTGTEISTGSLFTEVDTGDVYAWDEASTSWNKLMTLGSGGGTGGPTNMITDTFKFTDTGAHDITIPYTGDGYVVNICIFSVDAIRNTSYPFGNLRQQYAIATISYFKDYPDKTPEYYGNDPSKDGTNYTALYKTSSTSPTQYSDSTGPGSTYSNTAATGSNSATGINAVRLKNNKTMSVYTTGTGGTYAFANNMEYRYVAYYSE